MQDAQGKLTIYRDQLPVCYNLPTRSELHNIA